MIGAAVGVAGLATPLAAQPGRVEARATATTASFLDEDFDPHWGGGGAIRFYVTKKLAIEPEFLYWRTSDFVTDQDYLFGANVAYDLVSAGKRIQPYVVGGVGWLHGRTSFANIRFSTNEANASGGLGVKVFLSERWFVAPEVRVGWEPLVRVSGSLGYVLRK